MDTCPAVIRWAIEGCDEWTVLCASAGQEGIARGLECYS